MPPPIPPAVIAAAIAEYRAALAALHRLSEQREALVVGRGRVELITDKNVEIRAQRIVTIAKRAALAALLGP